MPDRLLASLLLALFFTAGAGAPACAQSVPIRRASPPAAPAATAAPVIDKPGLSAHSKKVGFNPATRVFHDRACRHFNARFELLSAAEARARGGKACQACLK